MKDCQLDQVFTRAIIVQLLKLRWSLMFCETIWASKEIQW